MDKGLDLPGINPDYTDIEVDWILAARQTGSRSRAVLNEGVKAVNR